jgi:hypothetical protein
MTLATTSLAAYHSLDLTELEGRVLDAIEAFGVDGCISDDVRGVFPSLSYSSVTARFASLEEKGRIYRAGDTRPGESGRQQKVMRHIEHTTAVPPLPVTKPKGNPFLDGLMRAARVVIDADPSFKGTVGAMALKAEILRIARR